MPTIEISCVEVWREISNYLDNEISVELRERTRRVQQAAVQKDSQTSLRLRQSRETLLGSEGISYVLVIHVHPELPIAFFVSPPNIYIAISPVYGLPAIFGRQR